MSRRKPLKSGDSKLCRSVYTNEPIPKEDCYLDQIRGYFRGRAADREKELEKHKKILDKKWRAILRVPRVVAVDVGFCYCETLDCYTDRLAIRIHFEENENCCDGSEMWSWLRLPQRTFWGVGQIFGAKVDLDKNHQIIGLKNIDIYSKAPIDPNSGNGKPDGLTWKEVTNTYRNHEFYFKALDDNIYVDLLNARYQSSTHRSSVRTGPPVPNTREFGNEAADRLGGQKVEPLAGGISLGNAQGSSGTLGAVVWDTKDGRPAILSNWHVLSGVPGSRLGDPCYQPALFEGGDPQEDEVGSLKRWIFDRRGDAGLAAISSGVDYAPGEIVGLWRPVWEMLEPKLGMQVRKWGRGSRFSKGFIDGVCMRVKVEYGNIGLQLFEDQFRIAPTYRGGEVSAQGDSGSVWVTKVEIPWNKNVDLVECFDEDAHLPRHLHGKRSARRKDLGMLPKKIPRSTKLRAYFAVCLQFAGDVPGSTLREHAVATSLTQLAKDLRFSFRPVFQDPDELIAQPRPRSRMGRRSTRDSRDASDGRPTSQISTDEGRRSIGPTPKPDPVQGHP